MPLLSTFGAASARVWGQIRSYVKPTMATCGPSPGTITSNTDGYALASFADNTFAYINAPKTSGKWYAEYVAGAGNSLPCVADDVSTTVSYGGYSASNAGVNLSNGISWVDSGWSGGSISGALMATTERLGLALDLDSSPKTFKIYKNNTLAITFAWNSGPTTLWLAFAAFNSPTGQIYLGPAACLYTPPSGYNHI